MGTWVIWAMGYMGNRVWGTGVGGTGGMGYKGYGDMGYMGNGVHGQ